MCDAVGCFARAQVYVVATTPVGKTRWAINVQACDTHGRRDAESVRTGAGGEWRDEVLVNVMLLPVELELAWERIVSR